MKIFDKNEKGNNRIYKLLAPSIFLLPLFFLIFMGYDYPTSIGDIPFFIKIINNPEYAFAAFLKHLKDVIFYFKPIVSGNPRITLAFNHLLLANLNLGYLINSIIVYLFTIVCFIYTFTRLPKFQSIQDALYYWVIFSLLWTTKYVINFYFYFPDSVNYTWSFMILMIVTLPSRYLLENKTLIPDKKNIAVLWLPLGFIAGMTNEHTVPIFIVAHIFFFINQYRKGNTVPKWGYMLLAGLILGFSKLFYLNLIVNRYGYTITNAVLFNLENFKKIGLIFPGYIINMPHLIVVLISTSVLFFYRIKVKREYQLLRIPIIFFFVAMATLLISIVVPIDILILSINKFAFANNALLVILIVWMIDKIVSWNQINKKMAVLFLSFFSIFIFMMMYFDYIRFSVFKTHMNKQNIQILQELNYTEKITIESYYYNRITRPIWNESIYKKNLLKLKNSKKRLLIEQKIIEELENFQNIRNDIPFVCKNAVLRRMFYCNDK